MWSKNEKAWNKSKFKWKWSKNEVRLTWKYVWCESKIKLWNESEVKYKIKVNLKWHESKMKVFVMWKWSESEMRLKCSLVKLKWD